jgi:GNAT superfamily N-acetyltransferase
MSDATLRLHDPLDEAAAQIISDQLHAYNRRHSSKGDPRESGLVAYDVTGAIVGGCTFRTRWHWLEIEDLWLEETWRGKGLGTQIMSQVEQFAIAKGCTQARLDTTSFQARPFYESLGYAICGSIEDYPPGHTLYFMRKSLTASVSTVRSADGVRVEIEPVAQRGSSAAITAGLRLYNVQFTTLPSAAHFNVVVRDADGTIVGGCVCETRWHWLYVDILWVHESLRGQDLGTQLLADAESEARRRGCTKAHLDTISFQARPFYEKLGWRLFGTLDDSPPGHTRYFLQKDLTPSS